MLRTIDTTLFFLINRHTANPLFDALMPALSDRGFLLAFPVLALAFYSLLRDRTSPVLNRGFLSLLVVTVPICAFFLADNLNDLLKWLIARPRPCRVLDGVRLLAHCPRSFSMPSGHAIASFAFAYTFFLLARNVVSSGWRWYVLLLAGAIAFSRVYIGVHYPTDVAAGSLLGLAAAYGISAPLLRLLRGRGLSVTVATRRKEP